MAVHEEGMQLDPGVMLYPGSGTADGHLGDHILLAPPYTVTAEEIEKIVALTKMAIDAWLKKANLSPQMI